MGFLLKFVVLFGWGVFGFRGRCVGAVVGNRHMVDYVCLPGLRLTFPASYSISMYGRTIVLQYVQWPLFATDRGCRHSFFTEIVLARCLLFAPLLTTIAFCLFAGLLQFAILVATIATSSISPINVLLSCPPN